MSESLASRPRELLPPPPPRLAWHTSLRGQLIISVALVHALMMAMFVWDLTQRQEHMLLERQAEQAQAMAESLAVSSAGWLAARDLAGLQEIIDAQRRYPELEFAMLVDSHGLILAHSNRARSGQYVDDLPARPGPTMVSQDAALVDVYNPVTLGGHQVGWARVGIGQRVAGNRLAEITLGGVYYALAAILLGSLMALWLGTRLTGKLYAISKVAESVRTGGRKHRAPPLGHDEAGVLAQDLNTMLDTLDRRDAEISASETRLRTLLRTIPDLVWLKDQDGVYLLCNPRFERFFGAREAEIVGRSDYDFIDRELADFFRAHDRKAMASDLPSINEEWVRFADDGHRELLETIKTPLRDGQGNLVGVLGIARDITERMRAEELQRYGAFQAGVAEMGVSVLHNIGNAITSVVADAEILRQSGADLDKVAALLRKSGAEGKARLAQAGLVSPMIDQLLAVQLEAAATIERLYRQGLDERARRVAGSVAHIADIVRIQQTAAMPGANASPFNLVEAVGDALAMQGDSLKQHDIHAEVKIDPTLGPVTLPRNQFLQAVLNLVKNAYESIRQRQEKSPMPGHIQVRAEALDAARFRLSVSDNGVGIAPGQRDKLFRFGYSTKARGSGFGLHATALFVQEVGGHIALDSDGPDQGARMLLELPRRAVPSGHPVESPSHEIAH